MKENLTRRGAGSNGFTLLASIYLSYVFHLWMEAWRQSDEGDTIVVRYADDAVLGFERCRGTLRASDVPAGGGSHPACGAPAS